MLGTLAVFRVEVWQSFHRTDRLFSMNIFGISFLMSDAKGHSLRPHHLFGPVTLPCGLKCGTFVFYVMSESMFSCRTEGHQNISLLSCPALPACPDTQTAVSPLLWLSYYLCWQIRGRNQSSSVTLIQTNASTDAGSLPKKSRLLFFGFEQHWATFHVTLYQDMWYNTDENIIIDQWWKHDFQVNTRTNSTVSETFKIKREMYMVETSFLENAHIS